MRVLAFGTFDLLHPGHEFVLREAAKRGDLTVVVARSTNVERFKKRPPVHGDDVRMANVRAVVPDATVILGHGDDFLAPVRDVQPDLIVLGYDQHLPPGVSEEDFPCPIERLPAFHPDQYKTTLIRERDGV